MAKTRNEVKSQTMTQSPDMGAIVQAVMAALAQSKPVVEKPVESKPIWPTGEALAVTAKLDGPIVEKKSSESLLGNLSVQAQAQKITTAAGYGLVLAPTMSLAEYRKACETAKASGRKWAHAFALYAWQKANPGKLAYGVSFTQAQHAEARKSWLDAKRESKAPTAAPSKSPTDLVAIAQAMRAAGFSAQEVAQALVK